METPNTTDPSTPVRTPDAIDVPAAATDTVLPASRVPSAVSDPGADAGAPARGDTDACPTCGTGSDGDVAVPRFVYAIGRIDPRFPSLSVEKEYVQAAGRMSSAGLTDRQVLQKILSVRENRYLARRMCWVFTVAGLETYLLLTRDPADLDLLVESVRPDAAPTRLDVIIGLKGPLAPPTACNGLMIPIVTVDQIYSFDRAELISSIPRGDNVPQETFQATAEDILDRILQVADNAGASDEHRALNYLVVRYPAIYNAAAEAFGRDEALSSIEVRPSPLSGTRQIVEVVFGFTNRNTDVISKSFARVDVSEEFPFLVTKLSPTFDR